MVVRRLGARVPENRWPAGCDPQAKGQLTCTSWQDVRWERGEATPTGEAGASLTQ